jgi:hypothetical protein
MARNPLTQSRKYVTYRLAGPASYSTGGDTWTFANVRNLRRVVQIVHDDGTTPAYEAYALNNNGAGNQRTVFVTGVNGIQTGAGTDLSGENFIATLELGE